MANTKIEWAEKVWNPVTGCTPVSDGCSNCYAARMAKRLRGRCGYPADEPFRVTLHGEKLDEPLRWRKPSRIFVCSMGDLFHDDVTDDVLYDVFDVMATANWHTFLILTKRSERMQWFITKQLMPSWRSEIPSRCYSWPLPNVWLGVTAENQEVADERIPILLQIPAAVRFVSVEPMLSPINLKKYYKDFEYGWECEYDWLYNPDGEPTLDWVICGSESGPNRRPAKIEWIRDLKEQCISANVPFFLKQMEINGRIVKMPELEGKIWAQFPEV